MKECPIFLMSPSPVNTHTDDAGDAVYIACIKWWLTCLQHSSSKQIANFLLTLTLTLLIVQIIV